MLWTKVKGYLGGQWYVMYNTMKYGDDRATGRIDLLWPFVFVLGGINSDIMLHPLTLHPSQASKTEC